MRGPGILGLLVVLLAAGLCPLATGHTGHGGTTMYLVNAHDAETENGTVAWFTIDNGTEANPSLTLHPGQQVRLVVINLGDRNHSLALGAPVDQTSKVVPPGEEAFLTFTVPTGASGQIPYQDPAYAEHGMQGTFQVATTAQTQNTPAPPSLAVLGALGLAGVASAGCLRDL